MVFSPALVISGTASTPTASGTRPKMKNSAILSSTGLLRQANQTDEQARVGLRSFNGVGMLFAGFRPAASRFVVGLLGLDPAPLGAIHKVLLLPEGGARFQIVHQEIRRLEG